MPGFLDEYGVADSKRERKRRRAILGSLAVAALTLVLYFTFRDWREERVVKAFAEQIRNRDYAAAHRIWGCTEARPCRDYSMEKFLEDWGPKSGLGPDPKPRVATSERCGTGVLFVIDVGGNRAVSLIVDRHDRTLGFAPWPECPGRKFLPWRWLKHKLGGTDPR